MLCVISLGFQRPTGVIPSSVLGLEALTGSLGFFDFENYRNDPRESETFQPADMLHEMEMERQVSDILRLASYNPVRSISSHLIEEKLAKYRAILRTFFVSGLMHELLILYHYGRVKPR
ncbi:hypothetical protein Ddye_012787 [Dipteronia dyeriana]|uniref:Uncharacterized protein n=1 Tax=Dipteronia dyeriana TaxID=168575 RepID=A0AAE0CJ06_9ROSI|nr:hypothetical protein Ddye_012787 [Dipteronia dyeriana]